MQIQRFHISGYGFLALAGQLPPLVPISPQRLSSEHAAPPAPTSPHQPSSAHANSAPRNFQPALFLDLGQMPKKQCRVDGEHLLFAISWGFALGAGLCTPWPPRAYLVLEPRALNTRLETQGVGASETNCAETLQKQTALTKCQ